MEDGRGDGRALGCSLISTIVPGAGAGAEWGSLLLEVGRRLHFELKIIITRIHMSMSIVS
jgi:hypothetical protein